MFEIRLAGGFDAQALCELYTNHLTAYPPEEPQDMLLWKEKIEQFADSGYYYILVGELEDKVVSSVTLVIIRNLTHNMRSYALIENVVTHADYRGRGFASALMERACEIAQVENCYKVMLMTGSKKESTLNFYEHCGFSRHEKTAFIRRLGI